MSAIILPIEITTDLASYLRGRKRRYPQHTNRISALDDPCLRRLYYARHDWDKPADTPDSLQGIFETGNVLEPVIERIISEVGQAARPRWRIIGAQTPTSDSLLSRYQISGTIDGFLQVDAGQGWQTLGVVDIKTMSPNIYPRINEYADLTRYAWTARYRGQLMLYALAHGCEECFLLLVNKSNLFDMKLISFPLDLDYCEGLLGKAAAVNESLAAGTPPTGVSDPEICPQCPWFAFCAPDMITGGNLAFADDGELESILDRLNELRGTAAEIADLERQRDARLTPGQDIACGRFIVTWKKIIVNRKATDANTIEQWRKKIVCMSPQDSQSEGPK